MRNILDFLTELAAHNDREWFAANKSRYIAANEVFNGFAAELLAEIQAFDPLTRGLTLRDCTYRIYRDTRFSHDKTPYKTHFGLYVCPGGKKSGNPGYYFHIQPVGDVSGGGASDGGATSTSGAVSGGGESWGASNTDNPDAGKKILDLGEQGVKRSESLVSDVVTTSTSGAVSGGGATSTSGAVSGGGESWGASNTDNPDAGKKILDLGEQGVKRSESLVSVGDVSGSGDGVSDADNPNAVGKGSAEAGGTLGDGGANHLMDAGVFMPWPNVLRSVRDEVFDNGEAVLAALKKAAAAGFELDRSNSLTRTPKGFPTATEWDDYLRLKDFHTTKPISEEYLLAPDLARRAARDFRATHEFMSLMQRAAQFAHDEAGTPTAGRR